MTESPDIPAKLIAEGRLEPAEDPEAWRKAEPVDRGISAAEIDAAVEEDRSR